MHDIIIKILDKDKNLGIILYRFHLRDGTNGFWVGDVCGVDTSVVSNGKGYSSIVYALRELAERATELKGGVKDSCHEMITVIFKGEPQEREWKCQYCGSPLDCSCITTSEPK